MVKAKTLQPIEPLIQKDWYCGPATLAMLYTAYGYTFSQDDIAEATGIREHIPGRGCRVDHLARAVNALTPDYALLGKYDSTIDDLKMMTDILGVPAAVEWRGAFLETSGHIWQEGHYSVVTHSDLIKGNLHLIDPFNGKNIAHQNGLIAVEDFVQRWWDDNYLPALDAPDPNNPECWTEHVWTDHLIFGLVPHTQANTFYEFNLSPVTIQLTWQNRKSGRTLDPTIPYRPTPSARQDSP